MIFIPPHGIGIHTGSLAQRDQGPGLRGQTGPEAECQTTTGFCLSKQEPTTSPKSRACFLRVEMSSLARSAQVSWEDLS